MKKTFNHRPTFNHRSTIFVTRGNYKFNGNPLTWFGASPNWNNVTMPDKPTWSSYQGQLDAYKSSLESSLQKKEVLGGTQIARTAGARGMMSATTIPQLYGQLETGLQEDFSNAMGVETAILNQQYVNALQNYGQFMANLQTQQETATAKGKGDFFKGLMNTLGVIINPVGSIASKASQALTGG